MGRRVAVLSVQGAFAEHEKKLVGLGASTLELRNRGDVLKSYDALILPGGESTVQGKLIRDLGMFDTLKEQILGKMPVMGTCAGLILLAAKLTNDDRLHFATLPVSVRRNGYGRQRESFFATGNFGAMTNVPMEFIRAPYVESADDGVQILSEVNGRIAAVQYEKQLALCFHPELCDDMRIYEHFLSL